MGTIGQLLVLLVTSVQIYELIVTHFLLLNRILEDHLLLRNLCSRIYAILSIFTTLSYFRAVFSNAGSIKQSAVLPSLILHDQWDRFCVLCNYRWKPPRAHHCKTCKHCIFRMDHHCEWINNCVGCYNHKYFILFLLYSFLQSVLTFGISITAFTYWASKLPKGTIMSAVFQLSLSRLGFALLLLLSLFFIFFTLEFLTSQISVIIDNQTTVESHKRQFGRPGELFDNFRQIFGRDVIFWLVPTKPNLDMNYLELAYELEYVEVHSKYFEDGLWDKSSQHYEWFREYDV